MVFIKAVFKIVKIGNIDVMLMIVKWMIKCVISSLYGISKRLFLAEGDVSVLMLG
jgi:hypothetical protein